MIRPRKESISQALTLAALVAPLHFTDLSPALAAPLMQLEQCIGLDRTELGHAIERELASSPTAAAGENLVVSARCDDGVSATVRVTERGTKREARRVLALGEVSAELRPRLLALVAVELAESLLATPPPPPPVPPAPLVPSVLSVPKAATKPVPPAASRLALVEKRPPPAPARPLPALAAASSVSASRSSPAQHRLGLSFGLGTRVYTETPDPLLQLSVELGTSWLTAGVVGALGSGLSPEETVGIADPEVGRFYFYQAGLSVHRQIACPRAGANELCFQLHGEGGLTGIHSGDLDRTFEAYAGRSAYLLGAVALEVRRPMDSLESSLRLELGYSLGDSVYLYDTPLVSFNGVVAMFNLGLRWTP